MADPISFWAVFWYGLAALILLGAAILWATLEDFLMWQHKVVLGSTGALFVILAGWAIVLWFHPNPAKAQSPSNQNCATTSEGNNTTINNNCGNIYNLLPQSPPLLPGTVIGTEVLGHSEYNVFSNPSQNSPLVGGESYITACPGQSVIGTFVGPGGSMSVTVGGGGGGPVIGYRSIITSDDRGCK
jgi:hypothetical protein